MVGWVPWAQYEDDEDEGSDAEAASVDRKMRRQQRIDRHAEGHRVLKEHHAEKVRAAAEDERAEASRLQATKASRRRQRRHGNDAAAMVSLRREQAAARIQSVARGGIARKKQRQACGSGGRSTPATPPHAVLASGTAVTAVTTDCVEGPEYPRCILDISTAALQERSNAH